MSVVHDIWLTIFARSGPESLEGLLVVLAYGGIGIWGDGVHIDGGVACDVRAGRDVCGRTLLRIMGW